MKKKNKILFGVIAILILGTLAFASTSTDFALFQGKMLKFSPKLIKNTDKVTTVPKVICSDSDGGRNYLVAGGVTLFDYPSGKITKKDHCLGGDQKLQEYVCEKNKYKGDHIFDCSDLGENYVCVEDACVEVCDNEINIESDMNQEFTIDYCTHLMNENNMKVYYSYNSGDEKLVIYSVREFEEQDYLLDYMFFDISNRDWAFPVTYIPRNIYSNGERFVVTDANESEITFRLEDNCPLNYPYCNLLEEDVSDYYFVEDGVFKYYLDNSLFNSLDVRNDYVAAMIDVDSESMDFLQNSIGFLPPIDKFVQFGIYTPDADSGSSLASGFKIVNYLIDQITQEDVEFLLYGNTHEFIHIFFSGTPLMRARNSWFFEEGLADYMGHVEQGQRANLSCRDDGWEYGYHDDNGNFVANSPFVPYSDFTVWAQNTEDFYDPLNTSSYYRSAECFWVYIEENYGSDAIGNVARAWHNTRKTLPPEEKWLVGDIINPTLGVDLAHLIQERYNYVEE